MGDEKMMGDSSDLKALTDVTEASGVSPSAKLAVPFNADHNPEGDGSFRPRGYSQNRWSSRAGVKGTVVFVSWMLTSLFHFMT